MTQFEIYELLKNSPKPLSTKDIAKALGSEQNKIGIALRKLKRFFPIMTCKKPVANKRGYLYIPHYFIGEEEYKEQDSSKITKTKV